MTMVRYMRMPDPERKKSVLIVEDDPEIRTLYAHALSSAGLMVFLAEDGEIALSTALEKRPDALLLDVLVPKMNGIEVLKKVREAGEWGTHVPAILLTNVEPTTDAMNNDIAYTAPTYYLMKNFVVPDDVVAKVLERLSNA